MASVLVDKIQAFISFIEHQNISEICNVKSRNSYTATATKTNVKVKCRVNTSPVELTSVSYPKSNKELLGKCY